MKELDRIVQKGDQKKSNIKDNEKKNSPLKNDESWLDMSDRPDAELEQSEKYER